MQFKAALISGVLVSGVMAALVGAPAAFAQSSSTSAPAADQAPMATTGAKATDENISRFLQDEGKAPPDQGPGLGDAGGPPPRDKAIHGEMGFSVGNHGYREGYGVAVIPLGDRGTATVAVDAGQIQMRGRSYNNRSVAVRLAFGDFAGPEGFAGPRDVCDFSHRGNAYLEPDWYIRMRQDQLAQQGRPCP